MCSLDRINSNIFYVYQYVRKSDGTPYYVGKGKESRAYDPHGAISVPKDRSKIQFVAIDLLEEDAKALEINLIQQYGRKDLGTGILLNRTNGGDGASGYRHTDEARAKMSEIRKGKPANPKAIKAMAKRNKGIPRLQETKDKQSAKMLGRAHSEETRNKLSMIQKGKLKGPRSEKAKASISEAMKLVWQQRKIMREVNKNAE